METSPEPQEINREGLGEVAEGGCGRGRAVRRGGISRMCRMKRGHSFQQQLDSIGVRGEEGSTEGGCVLLSWQCLFRVDLEVTVN